MAFMNSDLCCRRGLKHSNKWSRRLLSSTGLCICITRSNKWNNECINNANSGTDTKTLWNWWGIALTHHPSYLSTWRRGAYTTTYIRYILLYKCYIYMWHDIGNVNFRVTSHSTGISGAQFWRIVAGGWHGSTKANPHLFTRMSNRKHRDVNLTAS